MSLSLIIMTKGGGDPLKLTLQSDEKNVIIHGYKTN